MLFRFYYLKENTRVFDRTDLLTFFQANPNVVIEKKNDDRLFIYHHPTLNFESSFILSAKSAIPHL